MFESILQNILEIDSTPVEYNEICDGYYQFEINGRIYHIMFVLEETQGYKFCSFAFSTEKDGIHSIELLGDFNYPAKVKSTILNILEEYLNSNNIDVLTFTGDLKEKSRIKKYNFYALRFVSKFNFSCMFNFINNEETIYLLIKDKKGCEYFSKNKDKITNQWNKIKNNIESYIDNMLKNC